MGHDTLNVVPTEPTTITRSATPAGADVTTLTFDHGPLNLFDQAMFDLLTANVADLAAHPPRALLLRAEGKVNSAGVDVHVFETQPEELAWLAGRRVDAVDGRAAATRRARRVRKGPRTRHDG